MDAEKKNRHCVSRMEWEKGTGIHGYIRIKKKKVLCYMKNTSL